MRVLCFEDLGFGGWVIFSPDKLPSWGGAGAVGGRVRGVVGFRVRSKFSPGFRARV